MTSKQFATISLSPQAWKVETDNFLLALNKNDPNKEFPQSIYDRLSEPGRAPNANLTRAFVNTVKGIREGQLEIPVVEKKGITKITKQGKGGKVPSHTSPLTTSPSPSMTLDGLNNKNSVGLNNNSKSDDAYVTPEEKKDEEPEQPSNTRRALHPFFPPDSPNDGPVYNGPWNEDYLKKGNVVDNMKDLENFPFVQLTGSENATEAYILTSDHWKKVNDEFPLAHLHSVVVALYHSHMSVLEQMSHLEGNNKILQNNNAHLFETVQSLTTRLNELENTKPAAQIPPKKRNKWAE
jgi:hypothetical protein